MMQWLCDRTVDKEHQVRESSVIGISKIFSSNISMKWNGSEDEWDPTMGTNTFLAHIEQVQLERLSMIPNSIMNFANLTTMNDTIVPKTTSSSSSSSSKNGVAELLSKSLVMTKWNLVVRLFDEFMLFKKASPTSRAQCLLGIYHEFGTEQRKTFNKMISYRSKLANHLSSIIRIKNKYKKEKKTTAGSSRSSSSSSSNSAATSIHASIKMTIHRNGLIQLLGNDVGRLVYDTLVTYNNDKNIDKSILILTNVETTKNIGLEHRSRIIQSLRRNLSGKKINKKLLLSEKQSDQSDIRTFGNTNDDSQKQDSSSSSSSSSSSNSTTTSSSSTSISTTISSSSSLLTNMNGIDEIFQPILKLATLSTCVSSTDSSLGELMSTCLELADDDAYEKTISCLDLLLALSTKLNYVCGHTIYSDLMNLIEIMIEDKNTSTTTKKSGDDDDDDAMSESQESQESQDSQTLSQTSSLSSYSSERRESRMVRRASSMTVVERQNIVIKCLTIISSTITSCKKMKNDDSSMNNPIKLLRKGM